MQGQVVRWVREAPQGAQVAGSGRGGDGSIFLL